MGHRYYPEHRGDHWFVLTNRDGRINFDLVRARLTRPGEDDWASVPGVPGGGGEGCDGVGGGGGALFQWSEGRTLESMSAFKDFLVLEGREGGIQRHVGAPSSRTVRDATAMSTPGACIASWHKTCVAVPELLRVHVRGER
jgi:oligopeptidase B